MGKPILPILSELPHSVAAWLTPVLGFSFIKPRSLSGLNTMCKSHSMHGLGRPCPLLLHSKYCLSLLFPGHSCSDECFLVTPVPKGPMVPQTETFTSYVSAELSDFIHVPPVVCRLCSMQKQPFLFFLPPGEQGAGSIMSILWQWQQYIRVGRGHALPLKTLGWTWNCHCYLILLAGAS